MALRVIPTGHCDTYVRRIYQLINFSNILFSYTVDNGQFCGVYVPRPPLDTALSLMVTTLGLMKCKKCDCRRFSRQSNDQRVNQTFSIYIKHDLHCFVLSPDLHSMGKSHYQKGSRKTYIFFQIESVPKSF